MDTQTQKDRVLTTINFQLEEAEENILEFAQKLTDEVAKGRSGEAGFGVLHHFEWARGEFINAAQIQVLRTIKRVIQNEENTLQKACEILLREANRKIRQVCRSGQSTSPASNLAEMALAESWERQIDNLEYWLQRATDEQVEA